ncbi:sensor histidine kinase [Paenibacillus alginolyticus]|uniref:Heme sensor protein HssS n=1 Tax=Paenibacillus alginolyticus TaxID=59839 RepID=A0ABT4GEV5_9BACL|nr:HAMP domain-containing sensor histidine kinase [Paenibacillus alginolyticus]MCY9694721.1 HAMP domain-containing histidine kinase [Paenibacillus alginolyticus]MEC0147108.1 HAMP domain-containing sensor histidine kinase [Paenibacillus alginolyticus]
MIKIKSLYLRVVLTFLAIVVVSLSVAFWLATFFFMNRIAMDNQTEMLAKSRQIVKLIEDVQPSNLDSFVAGSNRLNENYIFTLFNAKGEPATEISKDKRGKPRILASEVDFVLQGNMYKSLDYGIPKDPINQIKVGIPLRVGDTTYALFIHQNISEAARRQGQTAIITVLLIVLIVGSLLILVASRYLVNPLKKLTLATERLARGNFNVHVSVKQKDELGQLAQSFNHMAGELKQLEQMRQDFVSNVSHEIQSPLTSIRGFSKALRGSEIDEAERGRYLEIIERESERLARLSDNLLKLASLESEHHPFHPTTYDLDEQLRRIVVFYEPQWSSKQLELDLELPRVKVTADADQLSQVWMNLLGNAIKFTPVKGTIHIQLEPLNDRIRIRIQDSGIGIAASDQERIFERFYKADASRHRETGGSGLGLAIVRKIVELHHGTIELQSEIDIGTLFTVTIPILIYPTKK